jgi:hypothetical protein
MIMEHMNLLSVGELLMTMPYGDVCAVTRA